MFFIGFFSNIIPFIVIGLGSLSMIYYGNSEKINESFDSLFTINHEERTVDNSNIQLNDSFAKKAQQSKSIDGISSDNYSHLFYAYLESQIPVLNYRVPNFEPIRINQSRAPPSV